ncbi:MAG TPA: phage head-tail connector protein [Bryobacteraceae bacterium]|nr:phage head-tail connector protein [Bryobacteraceae bacterium]
MGSIVTVTTAADDYNLASLRKVKLDLNIEDTLSDEKLNEYIKQASGAFATECDRVFANETVSELFRVSGCVSQLKLSRFPNVDITSVTLNDAAITDYEVVPATGVLYRLDGSGNRTDWVTGKVVVVYSGGYKLLTGLPYDIERAVITLVKQFYFAAGRDPQLRSDDTPGVQSYTYQLGVLSEGSAYPPEFSKAVEKYRGMVA